MSKRWDSMRISATACVAFLGVLVYSLVVKRYLYASAAAMILAVAVFVFHRRLYEWIVLYTIRSRGGSLKAEEIIAEFRKPGGDALRRLLKARRISEVQGVVQAIRDGK